MTTRELSPDFKVVLLVVVAFTALSFVGSLVLTIPRETDTTKQVLEMTLTTFKLGFGALVGLLGGKTI
ncbi:MAG TPA: hypothetical protein VHN37_14130 [Actinomycetota bacterium]|nr:hypothetical protein [Actinomycetota bacterium]